MSVVDRIKAYKAAVAPVAGKDAVLRYPLTTEDALALVKELNLQVVSPGSELKEDLAALAQVKEEPDTVEGKILYYSRVASAAKNFWREIAGLSVDGVEVVRGS